MKYFSEQIQELSLPLPLKYLMWLALAERESKLAGPEDAARRTTLWNEMLEKLNVSQSQRVIIDSFKPPIEAQARKLESLFQNLESQREELMKHITNVEEIFDESRLSMSPLQIAALIHLMQKVCECPTSL